MIENLALQQIVRQEQRRQGTSRDKIDVDYCVLTEYGKDFILALNRKKKENVENSLWNYENSNSCGLIFKSFLIDFGLVIVEP